MVRLIQIKFIFFIWLSCRVVMAQQQSTEILSFCCYSLLYSSSNVTATPAKNQKASLRFRNWANSIYFTEFSSGVWGQNSQNNIRGNLVRENFCPHGICFHIYIYVALPLVLFFSCHISNMKLRVVFPAFYQAPPINLPRVYGGGLPGELIVINQGPLGTFAWNFALP